MSNGDDCMIPTCQAWLAWLLSLLSPARGRRLFSLGRLTDAGPASYSGQSFSLGAHRHTRLQHSIVTLRKPAWYVCVCTLSPGWSPSSVARMHPGSDPASPPQLSSSASPPQLSSSASPPQLSSSAFPPQLSSSASPPQLSSNASRHVPIGIEFLILAIRTTDLDPTGAPTEHPRRFCVSAPLSWSY